MPAFRWMSTPTISQIVLAPTQETLTLSHMGVQHWEPGQLISFSPDTQARPRAQSR